MTVRPGDVTVCGEDVEIPAAGVGEEQPAVAWAGELCLPRRVFARSPHERKPRYVDFESPSLRRQLVRFVAPAREQLPDRPVEFTEMLPGPDDCWLQSDAGHHTSELRIVALDRTNQRKGTLATDSGGDGKGIDHFEDSGIPPAVVAALGACGIELSE